MKFTLHCPACKQDFSCFRQVNKLYILFAKCPHCRSSLAVKNVAILHAFVLLACALLAVFYVQYQLAFQRPINFLIPIALILLYEAITAVIMANKGTLVIRHNRYIKPKSSEPKGLEEE